MGANHISGTAEAIEVKFCTLVGYVKSQYADDKYDPKKGRGLGYESRQPWYDRLPPNGRGHGHVTRLLKFCPNHISVVGETKHFKCRVLIDTEVY